MKKVSRILKGLIGLGILTAGISWIETVVAIDLGRADGATEQFAMEPAAVFTVFEVNSTGDTDDGSCAPVGTGNGCTLREAINEANANPDLSTINFNIPDADGGCDPMAGVTGEVCTIAPTSGLNTMNWPTIVDGYSQPGSSVNTLSMGSNAVIHIMLDGVNAGGPFGALTSAAAGSNVRGLSIVRYSVHGLYLQAPTGTGSVASGNFLGLDPTGTTVAGITGAGLYVDGGAHTIGGTAPADRNVISGNGSGIALLGSPTSGTTVAGNYIGTDRHGMADLGNLSEGITIALGANGNQVGGTSPASQNVISGNNGIGVRIVDNDTANNIVQGNFIGVAADGTTSLPNSTEGVAIGGNSGTTGNTIGGVIVGAGNIIANNGLAGVHVGGNGGLNNPIRGNSIFNNNGLGIDLEGNGITPNDNGDGDAGPNNLQNFPVLGAAFTTPTNTISGTLNSTPNSGFGYTIDFYSNASCNSAPPFGEGQTYLGSVVTSPTDGSGNVAPFTFNPGSLTIGSFITATATDSNNNTSEFSQCMVVTSTLSGPSTFQFVSPGIPVPENIGGGVFPLTITRTGYLGNSATVNLVLSNASAIGGVGPVCAPGNDFLMLAPVITVLSFAPNAPSVTVPVTICNDNVDEPNEFFTASLSVPTGAGTSLGAPAISTVTIVNDDAPPLPNTIQFSTPGISVPENVGLVPLTITRTGNLSNSATVNLTLSNGNAIGGPGPVCGPGNDFLQLAPIVTVVNFAPNAATATVTVTLCNDSVDEPNEFFTASLSAPTGIGTTLGAPSTFSVTVINDDAPPAFRMGASLFVTTENTPGQVTISVLRTGLLTSPATVDLSPVNGSATSGVGPACGPGDDFVFPTAFTTVSFAPNVSLVPVPIVICNDSNFEESETFTVALSNPTGPGMLLGAPSTASVMIINDEPLPNPTPVCDETTTVLTNPIPAPISDNTVTTSTIVVSGADSFLNGVDLQTFITHTANGDIDMTLTSPAGTVVTLTSDNGGVADNIFNGTQWTDRANAGGAVPYLFSSFNHGVISDSVFINNAAILAAVPEEAMGAFRGEDPNGTWTLRIFDDTAANTGSLSSWSLTLRTVPTDPIIYPPTSFTNGTPVAISPSGTPTITSTISVSGLSGDIEKLEAMTAISHSFNSDLEITVTSPQGTIVTLTSRNGGNGADGYSGTTWSDTADPGNQVPFPANTFAASNLVTDTVFANLVAKANLVPEEAMGAFKGEDPNGTWTITIADRFNVDGGTLNSWGLNIATSRCDKDNDGVPDESDNCPTATNPDQANYDGDSMGDVCDPDDDNDGVPDATDVVPFGSLSPVTVVNACNTGVQNYVFTNGTSFNDLIAQAAAAANNHGQFVSQVTQLANDWRRAGLISNSQKTAMMGCVN